MNSNILALRPTAPLTTKQKIGRYLLAAFMLIAGIGHESFARKDFQAQVPNWVPLNKDLVVILSGIVEIGLAGAYAGFQKQRVVVGITLAIFFVLIFPGNIAQFLNHRSAFGLNTDLARGLRLLFQPVLIIWALWASGATDNLKKAKR